MSPFALAEEDIVVHSLNELPSSYIEDPIHENTEKTIIHSESIKNEETISLLADKKSFEQEQQKTVITPPSLADLLSQVSASLFSKDQNSFLPSFS